MDVGVWLRGLGLEQYEALFRENDIDAEVLSDLTDGDLEKIGVSLGHRKRLLKAAAALAAGPAPTPPAAAAPVPACAPPDAAERRQLTVMFSDLVGSTALSARLDPEDMRQVIRAYQDTVSGVVARYDGFTAKFMGDGVLAYFGFPRAHEDDAARAVHAGLEITDAVAALQTRAREKLAARVGIATGLVVVGDLVGHGPAQEQAVVGDTPNLAARLQGLADAGGVVVSSATRRLIGDRFRLRYLGRHAVKGLAEPVEAYGALGVFQSESRFEAAHSARLTCLVGREAESAELIAHQSELVFRHGAPPDARYTFKHALVQDTAYESLLKSRRQILHRKIAETLREQFPDIVEAEPELLADHFTQAGLAAPAIEYCGKAGDLALRRSAFKEAIAHLGKAIEMTEAVAGAGEADGTGAKLKLQVAYGNAMIAAHGHGAPETLAAFRRAHELGADAADVDSRFSSNYGLWAGSYVHGDLPGMLGPAQAFLHDVELRPGSPEAGVAHRAYGVTQWFTGNHIEARAHL